MKKKVYMFISTREEGRLPKLIWYGDIWQDEKEIIKQCRELMKKSWALDNPQITDEEFESKIKDRREWAKGTNESKDSNVVKRPWYQT